MNFTGLHAELKITDYEPAHSTGFASSVSLLCPSSPSNRRLGIVPNTHIVNRNKFRPRVEKGIKYLSKLMHIREPNMEFRPGSIRHLCLMTASMRERGDGEKMWIEKCRMQSAYKVEVRIKSRPPCVVRSYPGCSGGQAQATERARYAMGLQRQSFPYPVKASVHRL